MKQAQSPRPVRRPVPRRGGATAFLPAAALALLFLGATLPSCAHAPQGRAGGAGNPGSAAAGPSPLPTERVTSPPALVERLAARLPEAEGRLLLLGHPEAFFPHLQPLLRSGAIRQALLVLPTASPLDGEMVEWLRGLLEHEGVPEAERRSFTLAGGSLSGPVGRGELSFRTLAALPRLADPRVAVVETEFLGEFYRNDVSTPLLLLAKRTLVTLREKEARFTSLLLYDDPERPGYPLELAILPRLTAEMLSRPDLFEDSVPAKWEAFDTAEHDRYFRRHAAALAGYTAFLAAAPGDPSACYRIARMAALDGAYGTALEWLGRASAAEPAFRRGYAEMADYLAGRGEEAAAEATLAAALERFPRDPLLSDGLASLRIERGEEARSRGDREEAARLFREALAVTGADPALLRRAGELLRQTSPPAPGSAP